MKQCLQMYQFILIRNTYEWIVRNLNIVLFEFNYNPGNWYMFFVPVVVQQSVIHNINGWICYKYCVCRLYDCAVQQCIVIKKITLMYGVKFEFNDKSSCIRKKILLETFVLTFNSN